MPFINHIIASIKLKVNKYLLIYDKYLLKSNNTITPLLAAGLLTSKFVQKYQINQITNLYIMNYSQIIHNILFLFNICMLSLIYREAGEAFRGKGFGKIT